MNTINYKATLQACLDSLNRGGTSIEVNSFNERLKKNPNKWLAEVAKFAKVPIVFLKDGETNSNSELLSINQISCIKKGQLILGKQYAITVPL
ncbi:MAG: hypothetical protein LBG59_03405 [Candidatus Peribacteria bacterium]|jgi:hypothetical protein|nr:hypothetical protein [Candidatus Peribacteria bacterium]